MLRLLMFLLIGIGGAWHVETHAAWAEQDASVEQGPREPGGGKLSQVITMATTLLHGLGLSSLAISSGQPAKPVTPPDLSALISGGEPNLDAVPPEVLRFLNPSLLTVSASGTPTLNPTARQTIQQMIAEARANPAAFKAHYGPLAHEAVAGNVPPEFLRYLNPVLLTTSASGEQTLNPTAQAMLHGAIAIARANRAAINEQLKQLVGARRGTR